MFREKLTRREAVKTIFWGTAYSAVLGNAWSQKTVNEISAFQADEIATLRVRLSEFPALEQPFGSVRLGTSGISPVSRMPLGLYYPVIISRGANDDFHAVSAECTHAGCTVATLDPRDRVLACPCHGSRYSIDGTVVQPPANFPLTRYDIQRTDRDELLIAIPNLFLNVAISVAQSQPGRIELRFLGFSNIEYEIRRFSNLGGDDEAVPFALSQTEPLDQISMVGKDDFASVYVEAPSTGGFYQAVMKVMPV